MTNAQNAAPGLMLVLTLTALILGAAPILHNRWRRTHHAFAGFAFALAACFAAGGLRGAGIGPAELVSRIELFLLALLPVLFCQFALFLPGQRFEGNRWILAACYGGACLAALPQHLFPAAPRVQLGTAAFCFAYAVWNLAHKLRGSTGVHQRQLHHVLTALTFTALLAVLLTLLTPSGEWAALTHHAPGALILLAGWCSVALVRYHLPTVRWVIARITVSICLAAIVTACIVAALGIGKWLIIDEGPLSHYAPMALAALMAALVIQPAKEALDNFARRKMLRNGLDAEGLIARITRASVTIRGLDELLGHTGEDLRQSLQSRLIRIWLRDPQDKDTLHLAYSSETVDARTRDYGQRFLIQYLEANPKPLVLERLIHRRPTEEVARVARHLAELDAFLLVPLQSRLGLTGFIVLGEKWNKDIFTPEEVRTLETAAAPLAQAIETVRLYEELAAINKRLEGVLTAMRGGIAVLDAHGKITTVNREARRLLGDVTAGATVQQLPKELRAWICRATKEKRDIQDIELCIQGAEGGEVPVALSVSLLEDGGDGAPSTLLHLYDMTEIKRVESTVRRADRLHAIGTLAAGMAHEIKNPLQSIKTFTQLLLERFDDPDFRKTYVEVVPPEVKRIDGIVSRLLHFSRPKATCFTCHDVREGIEHVLALVGMQLKNLNISVTRNFPDGPVLVRGDEQQLHQVFLNLVLNAIEAMSDAEERRLHFEATPLRTGLPPKNGGAVQDEACVRIVVSDTGRGIEQKHLDELFTPFFTTSEAGSGLGLAVVHGIVSDHKGTINVSSVHGVGTSVSLLLPAADAPSPAEGSKR